MKEILCIATALPSSVLSLIRDIFLSSSVRPASVTYPAPFQSHLPLPPTLPSPLLALSLFGPCSSPSLPQSVPLRFISLSHTPHPSHFGGESRPAQLLGMTAKLDLAQLCARRVWNSSPRAPSPTAFAVGGGRLPAQRRRHAAQGIAASERR